MNELAELRQWLTDNWDPELSLLQWRGRLADAGWAFPAWPEPWCGRSLPPAAAASVAQELIAAAVPPPPDGVGTILAAPVLLEYGSDDLKRRLIRPTVTGEVSWCQLYTELSTRCRGVYTDPSGTREGPRHPPRRVR